MGVKRVKGRYVMKPWRRVGSGDLSGVAGFVMNTIKVGTNLIVMQCRASSAKMVADAIESEGWSEVAGLIASDDTIFIATMDEEAQQRLFVLIGDGLVF
jgi:arginine repressor